MSRRLLLAVVALGAVGVLRTVGAMGAEDKRGEMAPSPAFMMSSRYGRSPQRMMSPRNDRFFMSSRYGKRSELEGEPLPPLAALRGPSPPAPARPRNEPARARAAQAQLSCEYTGVTSLYRCRPNEPIPDRRFLESSSEAD